jgi:predicted nucleic acid-binding protein
MHKRIFVDANVILDLFEEKRRFHQHSKNVLSELFLNEEISLFVSSDMISNIFYILRNSFKKSFDDTLAAIENIANMFNVHSVNSDNIYTSIDICKKHIFKDYEDALQFMCALEEECTLIITNNPKDFKNASIDIVTTEELSIIFRRPL